MAYNKKGSELEITEEFFLREMDSCVRSCGTLAFRKAKGGLFTKSNFIIISEPKPAKCFSILGFKTLQGQRTFNIECDKEEECINYVDFISILINSFKTMKDEISSNVDSKCSSLK
jgi:hypothetical protein